MLTAQSVAMWEHSRLPSHRQSYSRRMPKVTIDVIEADLSRELRRSVLRPALPPGSPMPGDADPAVIHLGAYYEAGLVSACLIFPEPCPWQLGRPSWRLRGMATDPQHRGIGAGSALLATAAQTAAAGGAEILWCLARETATGFYRRNGWQEYGSLFDTEVGPHLQMWLKLVT